MLGQPQERNSFLLELASAESALLRPHLVPFELRIGDCLHFFGDPVEDVIFPHSGLVAMTMPLRESSGAGVVLVGSEGIIGGFAAAASSPATCDAEVYIAGKASRMPASTFRYILDQSPSLRRRAARYDTAMLAQAQQTALCHAAHPVGARICRWLLEVQDRNGSNKVPLTQNTLAQMLGVRRTTVTLVAGRLEAAGVLRCHRGYMEILNQEELRRHSCECHAHLQGYMAVLFASPREGEELRARTDKVDLRVG